MPPRRRFSDLGAPAAKRAAVVSTSSSRNAYASVIFCWVVSLKIDLALIRKPRRHASAFSPGQAGSRKKAS